MSIAPKTVAGIPGIRTYRERIDERRRAKEAASGGDITRMRSMSLRRSRAARLSPLWSLSCCRCSDCSFGILRANIAVKSWRTTRPPRLLRLSPWKLRSYSRTPPRSCFPGNMQAYTLAPIYARTTGYVKVWYHDIGTAFTKAICSR